MTSRNEIDNKMDRKGGESERSVENEGEPRFPCVFRDIRTFYKNDLDWLKNSRIWKG